MVALHNENERKNNEKNENCFKNIYLCEERCGKVSLFIFFFKWKKKFDAFYVKKIKKKTVNFRHLCQNSSSF